MYGHPCSAPRNCQDPDAHTVPYAPTSTHPNGISIGSSDFAGFAVVINRLTRIGGGRGQWLGGTMASAEHEPITGVWGQSPQPSEVQGRAPGQGVFRPPEAESILVIGCPTEPANLAPLVKFSK